MAWAIVGLISLGCLAMIVGYLSGSIMGTNRAYEDGWQDCEDHYQSLIKTKGIVNLYTERQNFNDDVS